MCDRPLALPPECQSLPSSPSRILSSACLELGRGHPHTPTSCKGDKRGSEGQASVCAVPPCTSVGAFADALAAQETEKWRWLLARTGPEDVGGHLPSSPEQPGVSVSRSLMSGSAVGHKVEYLLGTSHTNKSGK